MPVAVRASAATLPRRSTAFAHLPTPAKVARLLELFPHLRPSLDGLLMEVWEKQHRLRRQRQARAALR